MSPRFITCQSCVKISSVPLGLYDRKIVYLDSEFEYRSKAQYTSFIHICMLYNFGFNYPRSGICQSA